MRWMVLASALMLSGCGGSSSGPDTVPISGTVTLNDKPLADAEITYINAGFSSFAKTNAEGKYTLVQGAVPGENQVSISKWEGEEGPPLSEEDGHDEGQIEAELDALGGAGAAANTLRQLVPEDYRKLTYSVPEGGSESADFRLTGS